VLNSYSDSGDHGTRQDVVMKKGRVLIHSSDTYIDRHEMIEIRRLASNGWGRVVNDEKNEKSTIMRRRTALSVSHSNVLCVLLLL
jgi:hypothetical protein